MAYSAHGATTLLCRLIFILLISGALGAAARGEDIHLELNPRICTLTASDKHCSTSVHAEWRSPSDESLCLVIVGRTDVKRCWEHYTHGTYSIDLVFSEDMTFQLRDPTLENVLASAALRVIREALSYRHRRREPWNLFD